MISVLIADSDLDYAEAMRLSLDEKGYAVTTCCSLQRCIQLIKSRDFEFIIIDLDMGEGEGEVFLKKVSESGKSTIFALVAQGDTRKAVDAMKIGANEVYVKPLNIDEFILNLDKFRKTQKLVPKKGTSKNLPKFTFARLASKSVKMHRIIEELRSFAKTDVNILFTGDSGTGKGFIAKTIHAESKRASKNFVEINCSAIPSSLLESELFGHEKGAFTDARETRGGLFELAHNSTLFLDEISTMDYNMQSKLLKVIEDFKFYRVGGRKEIEVNTRIITATNSDLKKLVKERQFREDLFYRLNVAAVHLPPLRERKRDIIDLFLDFINDFNQILGKNVARITPDVAEALVKYRWPGNIRELSNVAERLMVIIESDTITKGLLPPEILESNNYLSNSHDMVKSLNQLEKEHILQTLDVFEGNRSQTAKALGISRTTLIAKIKQYSQN